MASVKFYIKRTITNLEVPVILKFTIDRTHRFALATGERIPADCWDKKAQQAKKKYPNNLEFNQALLRIKSDLIQLYRDNKNSSLEELQEMARSLVKFGQASVPEKKSLSKILTAFISQYSKEKDRKTVQKYESLQVKLTMFQPALSIDGLDNNFLDAFKNFLYKQGLLDSTVFKYITNLSTVITWAMDRGHEVHITNGQPTHKSWRVIDRRNEPITLTLAELEKLQSLEITQDLIEEKIEFKKQARKDMLLPALMIARDAFIIECRTGQRISDLKRFDLKDVVGSVWTNTIRKGDRLKITRVRLPFNTSFTAPAWEILKKYDFKFPEISEQKLNENIKRVCKLAGIDYLVTKVRWKQNQRIEITKPKCDHLKNHSGRATFITLGLQYMKPKLVKDLVGVSWSTLKYYEGHSEDNTIIDGLNSIPQPAMKVG